VSNRASTDSVERFGGLAETYEKYRPTYPLESVRAILDGLRGGTLAGAPDVVDIGAGTGISSRALAAAGAHVVSVEPNDEMRELARRSGIDARPGGATATGLPDACADVVAAFQAFHWFAKPEAVAEFRRLLRPRGRLAIVWNERDRNDPFTAEFREIEERHCDPKLLAGADFADDRLQPLIEDGGFCDFRLRTFVNAQRLDEDGVIGRVRSSSYVPRGGPELEAFIADVLAVYARYRDAEGLVAMIYRTEVYLADLPA